MNQQPLIDPLTERELEVLDLVREGLTNREIAEELVIAPGTVKWYTKQIYSKLNVGNRTEAAKRATDLGLFTRAQEAPPPDTSKTSPAHNLPAQLTSFIGRKQQVAEITALLQSSRLVTLTGPGGTGKTRLALRVAANSLGPFSGGVYFVDLAPIVDPGLVAATIAQTLGINKDPSRPMEQTLAAYLRNKQVLLLLDNFEHLVAAAPLLSTLLARCPELTILVTSRAMLHLYGEQTYAVPPLSLPGAGFRGSAAQARAYEAVQLFLERAAVAQPNLAVDDRAIGYIAEICTRLDGLPLAIELAAARLRLYSLVALAEQLSHRFELLRRGPADLPARQRTLQATVDWSYETLDQDEKTLFARLAVFQGGRSLEAIEAVCAHDLDGDVIAAVESLRDKSLLRQERGAGGEPRFVLLETIHDYARQKLQERGERDDMQRRHAAWFLALAELAEPHLRGGRHHLSWLHRLESERDNIRAALEWSLGGGDVDLGQRLTAALHFFWLRSAYFEDVQKWTSQALAVANDADPRLRARLQLMQGGLAFFWQEPVSGKEALREAEAVFRQYGDTRETAYALMWRAMYSLGRGEEYEEDLAAAEEALTLLRALDDKIGIAQALNVIGEVTRVAGNDHRAEEVYHEALALSQEIGDPYREHFMYVNLGFTAEHKGEHNRAAELTRQAIALGRQMQADNLLPCAFAALAGPLASLGDARKATILLGAATALGEQLGVVFQPGDQVEIDRYETAIRAQLDESAFAAAWEAGRSMTVEEVLALAMS